MRTIFELTAENAKTEDCLADGAVRCEPLSTSNSLIIRENTGNFRDLGPLGTKVRPKNLVLAGVFAEIPYYGTREF